MSLSLIHVGSLSVDLLRRTQYIFAKTKNMLRLLVSIFLFSVVNSSKVSDVTLTGAILTSQVFIEYYFERKC